MDEEKYFSRKKYEMTGLEIFRASQMWKSMSNMQKREEGVVDFEAFLGKERRRLAEQNSYQSDVQFY